MARAATAVVMAAVTVPAVVAAAPWAPTQHLPTVATSPLALVRIPLSAFVKTRPQQLRTVKENKHAATCSPQVP